MVGEERESFRHPRLESGRRVFFDLADDVFAIAQPAQVREALAEDADLAAFLAGETVAQAVVSRPRSW